MSANMLVQLLWDGCLKPFASMRMPVKLIPQVGELMRVRSMVWRYNDARVAAAAKASGFPDDDDEDAQEAYVSATDGEWEYQQVVPAVVLERFVQVDYDMQPDEDEDDEHDTDASMHVIVVLGRPGEERPKK